MFYDYRSYSFLDNTTVNYNICLHILIFFYTDSKRDEKIVQDVDSVLTAEVGNHIIAEITIAKNKVLICLSKKLRMFLKLRFSHTTR